MIEIDGKQVFTELDELVAPAHTALLVVDMQRDFCSPGGAFDRLGVDITMYPPMVPRLERLVEAARAAGVRIVWILMTTLPGRLAESPAYIRFNMRMQAPAARGAAITYTEDGSEGQQLIEGLAPRPGELVVKKYRSSAFWGTNLDLLLRSNGIRTVVVTGCTTEGCVESTARDAMFNDLYVVLAEDCVASDDRAQHDASLFLMRRRFDVFASEQIGAQWSRASSATPGGERRSSTENPERSPNREPVA